MSMATANQLLRTLGGINKAKEAAGKGQPPAVKQTSHRPTGSMTMSSTEAQLSQMNQGMGAMRLEPTSPQMQPENAYQRQSQSPPMGAMNIPPQDPRYSPYPQTQQAAPPYPPGAMPPQSRLLAGARMPGSGPQGSYMDASIPQRHSAGYDQPPVPLGGDLDGSGSLGFDVRFYYLISFSRHELTRL
jgi:hypothetical protein